MHFLHTSPPNVAVFTDLVRRLAPDVEPKHLLLESVLKAAVGAGAVTDDMRQQTHAAVQQLVADGARVIVCTCSTIGGVAESVPVPEGVVVRRIDRAMAEEAVRSGRRIVVAATLASTLAPTTALIEQVAAAAGQTPAVVQLLCDQAWPHFERGDTAAYAQEIARAVADVADPERDVVVLAQASMAPAEPVLRAMGVLALSSPELGVRAALAEASDRQAR